MTTFPTTPFIHMSQRPDEPIEKFAQRVVDMNFFTNGRVAAKCHEHLGDINILARYMAAYGARMSQLRGGPNS